MAFDLNSITKEKRLRAPRVIILGPHKIGKSTLASQAPSPVILPIIKEEGIDDLDCAKWPEPAKSHKDVLDAITSLYTGEHNHKTVVIDSATTLEPLIWKSVCSRCPDKNGNIPKGIETVYGGWGKGYTEALTEWDEILTGLDALRAERNMICIIVGHIRIKLFNDPTGFSYDQYQFDLHDKAANKLYRWADSILFCNRKTVVRQEDAGFNKTIGKAKDPLKGKRFLFTQEQPAHPGGGRGVYGRLPYELDLSWTAFEEAISKVVQQEGKVNA